MRPQIFALILLSAFEVQAQEELPRYFFSAGLAGAYVDHERKIPNNLIGPKPDIGAAGSVLLLRRTRNQQYAWGIGSGIILWGDRQLYPVHLALHLDIATLFSKDKEFDGTRNDRWKLTAGLGLIVGRVSTMDGDMTKGVLYHAGYRYRITNGSTKVHVGLMTNMFEMRGPYRIFVDDQWIKGHAWFFFIGPAVWVDL